MVVEKRPIAIHNVMVTVEKQQREAVTIIQENAKVCRKEANATCESSRPGRARCEVAHQDATQGNPSGSTIGYLRVQNVSRHDDDNHLIPDSLTEGNDPISFTFYIDSQRRTK